jgi:AcrR family transcriptional regulator
MTEYSPRKRPQQARSRQTWESILDSAETLLVEEGYDALTTNRIAEEADISVGSVYQYFPNKEAILLTIMDRFAERQYEILVDGLDELADANLETAVQGIVSNMLAAKRDRPELNRVLFEQLPPVGQHDLHHEWNSRATELIRNTLAARDEKFAPNDLDTAAFILVNGVHGIVQGTVASRPELLDDERLHDETVSLVLGYLR